MDSAALLPRSPESGSSTSFWWRSAWPERMQFMWRQLLPGLRIKLFMTIVLGIAYPLAMTEISQVLFPAKANGSLIGNGGRVIGSELIGQNFSKPEYFHSRPSSAGNGYDATASGGSNLG